MSFEAIKAIHLFLLGEIGLIGILFFLLPRLTRPEIYFAVTVAPELRDSEEGRRVLRRYRQEVVLHALIALLVVLAGIATRIAPLVVAGIFWQVLGSFAALYRARRQVWPHAIKPTPLREAELVPRRERLPGGWLLQVGPFAVFVAVAIYLRYRWDLIPARFPVHWGLDGTPDRWAGRTVQGVYGPLLMGVVICASLLLVSYGILHWSRRVRASGRWAAREVRFRHTMLCIFLGTEYFFALSFAWLAPLPLFQQQKTTPGGLAVFLVGLTAFVAAIVLILIRTGQGGARLAEAAAEPAGAGEGVLLPGDRTPDQCWKAGLFYFNPADPALFVEARFGVGYTLNFGRIWSWVILSALVVVPVVLALLFRGSK